MSMNDSVVKERASAKSAEPTRMANGMGPSAKTSGQESAVAPEAVRPALIDRSVSGGNIGRLMIAGIIFLGVVALTVVLPPDQGNILRVVLFAGLAIFGVMALFSLALGVVQLSSRTHSESFARTYLDGLSRGAIITDWEDRIVYANQAYGDITGAGETGDVATIERVFSGFDDASEIVYQMNQKVRSGKTVTREFRVPRNIASQQGDGQSGSKWYRVVARALPHQFYSKPLIVWEISDVTGDRMRQESVFQDLQHAIDYLDHAPAGFFSANPDGEIVYINATLADWLGIDLTEFSPGKIAMSDLVQRDGMALIDSMAVRPGEAKTGVVDVDLARSDGRSLPVRLYHKVPFASDGAPGATRTIVLNRRAGSNGIDEIQAAELRFTRFFNNTPIAIASVLADGSISQSNAPFESFFAPVLKTLDRSKGVRVTDLCADNEADALTSALNQAREGMADIGHVDSTLPSDEGTSVRYFLSATTDGARAVEPHEEIAIFYAIEMSEQKALERQMAQGQKMQAVGQLAGGIAHDFNNVLTAIIGFSDLLLSNHRPSDPSFPDIMNIKQNANRAASLVRQLLAFSRRQTLRPQVLSLPDVLADLRMLLARLIGDKISLDIRHGRDLWPIKADIGQLEQVIVNLCVNGRDAINDATEEGGEITIRTSNLTAQEVATDHYRKEMTAADYVLIEVSDTGTGMTEEVMGKIFEPFFSTKEVGKGTGLGLSTVYGIVKQSGGFVYPKSELGKGTTFQIYIPRHEPTDAELAVAAEESVTKREPSVPLSGNATIVFVEDEDAVRAVGSRTLQQRGYTVHEAENGVVALELLEEYGDEVDLVVSDVVMPEMDGPTLLQEVRKSGNKVHFIFASGYAEEAFDKNLPESARGTFGFIPKPYSLKDLATVVKEVLDSRDEG